MLLLLDYLRHFPPLGRRKLEKLVVGGLKIVFSSVGCCWWVNGGRFFMEVVAGGLTGTFLMEVIVGGLTVAFSYV
jgi:hypothetical protein